MSKPVQFDSGDDFTTRALQARARGERVDSVLPPELLKVLKLIEPSPAPLQTAKPRKVLES
jgi:hypothetical protein